MKTLAILIPLLVASCTTSNIDMNHCIWVQVMPNPGNPLLAGPPPKGMKHARIYCRLSEDAP